MSELAATIESPARVPAPPPPPPVPRPARAPLPLSHAAGFALATGAPAALGALLAAQAHAAAPILAVPAIAFGVIAATSPALYIATTAAAGPAVAPPLAAMVRAFGVAFGAFGVALAGLLLPTAFLALSSLTTGTTVAVATAAFAAAALIGLRRLAVELGAGRVPSGTSTLVFVCWATATLGIAGRLWLELAGEVLS